MHITSPPPQKRHIRARIAQGVAHLLVLELAQAFERTEGRRPYRRRRVGQRGAGNVRVARVTSQGDQPAPLGDMAIRGARGRLHGTTMTAHDEDAPPAAGDPQVPWASSIAAPPAGTPAPDAGASQLPLSLFSRSTSHRGRRPRWRVWLWLAFIVIVVGIVVASRINLDDYAIEPGTAQSVQQFISVPADRSHPVLHPVLLTDVEIGRVTALSYLFYKLQSDTALEPVASVVGPFPPSQLIAEGNVEMSQAEAAAKTAALTKLGYPVTAVPSGAVVFGTFAGTPAASVLNVGDVIVAVDTTPVTTAEGLTRVLDRYHSGQTITLSVRRGGNGPARSVPVTLKASRVDLGAGQFATLDLGIEPQDQVDYRYPFPVKINVTNIGGPSAGLAMTLGVMDALTSGSITGGHTVAATGTIDAKGDVGDVGGVAQKTVAVERAGATIFLVPPQEYKAALSQDKPSLKVYAVSTLDQALAVLAAHGGGISTQPPATARSTPG